MGGAGKKERFAQRTAGGAVRWCLEVSAGHVLPAGQPSTDGRPKDWAFYFPWGLGKIVLSGPGRVPCTGACV